MDSEAASLAIASQSKVDARNAAFWDEMCGSAAAKALGIAGDDSASLAMFDRWFFELHPYLDRLIDFPSLAGKDVLEVGLGYGSVAQRLAEAGARYHGLDIAAGPVAGVNHRMAQSRLGGRATPGSILAAPFDDASFDAVVAIGCDNYTGNLVRAIAEIARILRPGGRAVIMVCNALSYLRWIKAPGRTLGYAWRDARGGAEPMPLDAEGRAAFDADTKGNAAPETVLVSKRHLRRLLRAHFPTVRIERANFGLHRATRLVPRRLLLATVAPWLGLDLYARAGK